MTPCFKEKFNISMPTNPRPFKLPIILEPSKNLSKTNTSLCIRAQNALLLLMPSPAFVDTLPATCTRPPTSKANEDTKLKSPFMTAPFMSGARTTARCVTGAAGLDTTLRSVTVSDTAATAYIVVTMELTAFAPMTSVIRTRTIVMVRSPCLSVIQVLEFLTGVVPK